MAKFAANLSMMFNEVPFIQRFERAAQAGFTGVEYLFPYEEQPEAIAEELKKHGLTQALFNMPAGIGLLVSAEWHRYQVVKMNLQKAFIRHCTMLRH